MIDSIKLGFKKGIETTWMLAKIIVPVYIFVTILKHTPLIHWIASIFQPFMGLFDLPGEAVIVLVVGNVLDPYAAIGAMKAINLTSAQITTLAVMVGLSHSLFIESAIVKNLGLNMAMVSSIRMGLALVFGVLVGKVGGII
ncbi:nucleoside recognition domain-containing protein [Clostridiaceae bacterium 35-E11]